MSGKPVRNLANSQANPSLVTGHTHRKEAR